MTIDFIGHAGFSVTHDDYQVLLDPWLTASSFDNPVLSSFFSKHRSIDYLIPEPVHTHDFFAPDAILLSHHHTHHSSSLDIIRWLDQAQKQVTVISPSVGENYRNNEFNEIQSRYADRHRFLFVPNDQELQVGPFFLRAMSHTVPHHLAYYLKCSSGSFLHIADAKINRLAWDRRMDPVWMKFLDLNPSLLALTGGAMSARMGGREEPFIVENMFMSPVEAANFCASIKPATAGLMGFFNFSIWKNRHEYGFSASENEAYFEWALRHLDPEIRQTLLRPGLRLQIHDGRILSQVL